MVMNPEGPILGYILIPDTTKPYELEVSEVGEGTADPHEAYDTSGNLVPTGSIGVVNTGVSRRYTYPVGTAKIEVRWGPVSFGPGVQGVW